MRVTILTTGGRGDIQPYVGLGVGLQRAGHQVRIPAPEDFRDLITRAGLEFMPVEVLDGLNMQELLRLPEIQASLTGTVGPFSILAGLRIVQRQLARLPTNMLEMFWGFSENADLLVASTTAFGALDCAEKRGIKYLSAPLYPMMSPTRAFPSPLLAPFGVRLNSALNRLTYTVLYLAWWQLMHGVLDNWRRQMGLSLHSRSSYWHLAQAQTTIYGFSPSVLPTPTDWPPSHHVAGYWFYDEPADWQPPAGLVHFLESGPPPVCVGFGSMIAGDPARITRVVLEALALSNQRGVLLSGWGGLGARSLPETVYRLDAVPHSWLFPKVAAVVHHGGMGTTAAGLRAGVPNVILPVTIDQPFWARRVEQLGVGVRCASFATVTAKQLAVALDKVTSDTELRQRVTALGEKIQAEDGVGQAVAVIQNYLRER